MNVPVGQAAVPTIEKMNWNTKAEDRKNMKIDKFIELLLMARDSQEGEKLENIISTDILIKDLYMLEFNSKGACDNDCEPTAKLRVLADNIRIRSTPTTDGNNKIGNVRKAEIYNVYESKKNGDYTWYRIGKDQWVADDGTWLEMFN